jgi:hypothetical protein
MTVDLRGAGYAAGRISSTPKCGTKQFGWLQARNQNFFSFQELPRTLQPSEFVIFIAKDTESSSPTPRPTPIRRQ